MSRCTKVGALAEGLTLEGFKTNEVLHEALLRHLTIIGEAVKGIPDEMRAKAPDVPWRKIAGLRDHLVHVYFGIKDDIVFEIIQRDVPTLRQACESLLNEAN